VTNVNLLYFFVYLWFFKTWQKEENTNLSSKNEIFVKSYSVRYIQSLPVTKEWIRSRKIYNFEICSEEEFSERALKISLIYISSHFKRGAVFAQQKWRNLSNERHIYMFMLQDRIIIHYRNSSFIKLSKEISFTSVENEFDDVSPDDLIA